MFESLIDGITVTDRDGNIVQLNEAVVRMHGYHNKKELIGRNAFQLIADKDRARAMENLKKPLKAGYARDIQYTLWTRDGREFPAELSPWPSSARTVTVQRSPGVTPPAPTTSPPHSGAATPSRCQV